MTNEQQHKPLAARLKERQERLRCQCGCGVVSRLRVGNQWEREKHQQRIWQKRKPSTLEVDDFF